MAAITYHDREGSKISQAEWKTKRQDSDYSQLKAFDDGRVRVHLEWVGRVRDAMNSYSDSWPIFLLHVGNYDASGVLRADPIEDNKTFGDEASALKHYTEFLTRWTESHTVKNETTGEEELVEEGNTLAPPVPDDPNLPTTETDDSFGAW